MTANKKPDSAVTESTPTNNNISISGDVKDSTVIIGDNNTVNQTIIQKFFNIFKSDSETLEQRNRRILLGHVENAWIKGVLDASLHGAALLDLGIKQDPEAVTEYPWAIKKESTDETLPAGTSMLEIFENIGMGRSLLILGAPGSGKTTMLLELARQLIARSREDVTYPIPMVFNLASWTEKLTLADWLAQELNNLYSVPRKTAPDWVKGNKLLLLLDGLDEVRQESRAKCVEAINAFRKEHGLTSLAVCSRSQDYADLKAKLSFEGAIEVQSLTQKQITEFFNRFGDEMAGIKQALENDSALREMAGTPLFLSIMILAYRDKPNIDILISKDEKAQRKHLFDTYIERMFERPRSKKTTFEKQDILRWLSWLAQKMIKNNVVPYQIKNMQPIWLTKNKIRSYSRSGGLFVGPILGLFFGLLGGWLSSRFVREFNINLIGGLIGGLCIWIYFSFLFYDGSEIFVYDTSNSDRSKFENEKKIRLWLGFGLVAVISGLSGLFAGLVAGLVARVIAGLIVGIVVGLSVGISNGIKIGLIIGNKIGLSVGLNFGLVTWLILGLSMVGPPFIQRLILRIIIAHNHLLPWRLVPFLDHCVDLIFLRRVGGGYIFVHRLLMEHFAEMYVETPTSKGN